MVQTIKCLTGEDWGDVNNVDASAGTRTSALQNYVESHMGMIWHNVTDDFRLIAEGSLFRISLVWVDLKKMLAYL